jgi:hypothetical protein
MNGTQKGILVKLAGSIGVVGASLIALPSLAASPLNPSPKIFSEPSYNRLAQATPSMMTPATESVTTEDMNRSSSPSLAKVNPNPSIFNEAPYNRLLSQSTGGSSGTLSQPSGSSGAGSTSTDRPSAPVAEPSNIGPTIQQSPGSSQTTPGTNQTTPGSASPGSSGDVTVPTTPSESTTPNSTTTPGSTTAPDSTITPGSTTTPNSTTTPETTPSEGSTTPSQTPSGGQSGGVRALW